MRPLPDKDNRRETWAFIKEGLDEYIVNPIEEPSAETHTAMYTAIHNFCTLAWSNPPNITGLAPQYHCNITGLAPQYHCPTLYANIRGYLAQHLAQIYEKSKSYVGEALLHFYIQEWDRYFLAARQIDRWFNYLNTYWIGQAIEAGVPDMYYMYRLPFVQWKDLLLPLVHHNVTAAVLKMIEKQRSGEIIQHSLINSFHHFFVILGIKVGSAINSYLDLYCDYFEKPILEATTRYYENESAQYRSSMTLVEYMNNLEARIEKERWTTSLYMNPVSKEPLIKACLGFVGGFSGLLQDHVQTLLNKDKQYDLAQMYRIFSKTFDGLAYLRETFESHVMKFGQAAMDKVVVGGENLEPKIYVDALFEILFYFETLVNKAFAGDPRFADSLSTASKEFVERNKFCETGSNRTPELLAIHMDAVLKQEKTAEKSGFDKQIAQFQTVFKYTYDKDAFNVFYSRMLAKRLINFSSSEDGEVAMFKVLKDACGFEYTSKLEHMYQDNTSSLVLNAGYKHWKSNTSDMTLALDSNYHVLSAHFWPLKPPTTAFIPPSDIVEDYTRFETFYLDKHCRRKLTWMWDHCKGEMQANYITNAKIPCTFLVSTYQMAILLLFNENDVVTYDEAQKATWLSAKWLDSSLSIFVKAKVLIPSPKRAKPEPGTSYTLNYQLKSKQNKVNLNIAIKSQQNQDRDDIRKMTEGNKKHLTELAIVRIMKSCKKMKRVDLVQETIAAIQPSFVPEIPDIEKSIKELVEREYLESLESEYLGYLA